MEERPEAEFIPLEGNSFRFECHKGLRCWTRCCRALNLHLTPYDILRLKKRLGMKSGEFLDRFTDIKMEFPNPFPRVILKMKDEKERRCPFVTDAGCSVYEDRPSACRIYPLARASTKVQGEDRVRERYYIVKESHCLGLDESQREWKVAEWVKNEGLLYYFKMNDHWMEIVTDYKNLKHVEGLKEKMRIFYIASYDMDRFRELVFDKRFLRRFQIEESVLKDMDSDEDAFLNFSTDWLLYIFYGRRSSLFKTS